jgi:Glycosyl hydrolases family 16
MSSMTIYEQCWTDHFTAHNVMDLDKVVDTYSEDCVLQEYNNVTKVMNVYKGHFGVKEFFKIHLASLQMPDGTITKDFGVNLDPPEVRESTVWINFWGKSPTTEYKDSVDTIVMKQTGPATAKINFHYQFVNKYTLFENDYVEIFRDDFKTLDRKIWKFDLGRGPNNDGWGNFEKQSYTDSPRNAFVKDSVLNVKIIKEDTPTADGCDYTSARLTTAGTFKFTYGRVDTRVRLKEHVDGPFCAVWALSDQFIVPTDWPLCGEVDLFEFQTIFGVTPITLHFKDHSGLTGNPLSYPMDPNKRMLPANQWHDLGMEW